MENIEILEDLKIAEHDEGTALENIEILEDLEIAELDEEAAEENIELLEALKFYEAEEEETIEEKPAENQSAGEFKSVYEDTLRFVDRLEEKYDFYPETMRMLGDNARIELKKRFMLKAIDETWVEKIEDCLTALDEVTRKPSRFIEESEKVLPIELSRNISSRSLRHLSQHTDYISKVEGDMVTPSKILNVFRDETNKTYENKFVNTLINRLFLFVERRYETALKEGKDEKNTSIDYKDEFTHGDVKGKISFRVEISEEPKEGEELKNYTYTTDLWQRVIKLHHICRAYINSDFVKSMDGQFVRPPIIRTNAILKNKNLRQCLELWEFIEGYENIGYNMLIEEQLEDIDKKYIKEIYSNSVLQYLIFRYNIKNEFENDKALARGETAAPIAPRVENELGEISREEFDHGLEHVRKSYCRGPVEGSKLCKRDVKMIRAASVALSADSVINEYDLVGAMPRRKKPTAADKLAKKVENIKKKADAATKELKNAASSTKNFREGVKRTWEDTKSGAKKFYRAHNKEVDAAINVASDLALKAALAGAVLMGHQIKKRK